MSNVIIGNCVVSKFMGSGTCIREIKVALKEPEFKRMAMQELPMFTAGSKKKDARLLQMIGDGYITMEEAIRLCKDSMQIVDEIDL